MYTISDLSKMAGISTRTLRYYDEIGLLSPSRINSSGYRIYTQDDVDKLQQILFYKELEFPLAKIKNNMMSSDFDILSSLEKHLQMLKSKIDRLETLIETVKKTIGTIKGEIFMNDNEKFIGFKESAIEDNEKKYGEEIRKKYGDTVIYTANEKFRGLSPQQYAEMEQLSSGLNEKLKEAFIQGDPSSESAQKVCEMHKKWLGFFWNSYSPQAHLSLAQMYIEDPRFTAYYDNIAPGCAVFLHDALNIYCS